MNGVTQLKMENLQRLCDEHEEESLRLEFKPCNELKAGTSFRDKSGAERTRLKDDVLDELTKDVTAFLNSAGGTIIYGIQEKKSHADEIDRIHSFKLDSDQDNIRPEKVIDWLRAHVQPSPAVNVYRISENLDDAQSPWYLVIEIPQGEQAYMARDHRFYKRIGSVRQPMEQYEVVDAMNRTQAAALDLKIQIDQHPPISTELWATLRLNIAITSANFVASEFGAFKLTVAYPLRFSRKTRMAFKEISQLDSSADIRLIGDHVVQAQAIAYRWGIHNGTAILPGDWFDFLGHPYLIDMPNLLVIPDPTYLLQAELFTGNSQGKRVFYSIQKQPSSDKLTLSPIAPSNWTNLAASFQQTYDLALHDQRISKSYRNFGLKIDTPN